MIQQRRSVVQRSLDAIEQMGNKLPHPITLFFIFAFLVVIISALFSAMGIMVEDPRNEGEILTVKNLLSADGIQYMFTSAVDNFTGFAPLGTVLVTMLGIGIAERSGLISTMLRGLVTSVPRQLLTATLVFAGIMSSMAADAGYVVLTPLGAVLFAALGRHPLAGLAAAFAGVSAGYSANLLLTSLDPLLGSLTQQAAATYDQAYAETINLAMNYYFMIVSVFVLTLVGTYVTDKIVEPRLGSYDGGIQAEEVNKLKPEEKKGLIGAGIAFIVTCAVLALLIVPEWGPLRGPEGEIVNSPFFMSLVPVILIMFLVPGLVYGIITKNITTDKDVADQMSDTMATMGAYIVLAFAAGQFVAYFNETNMGIILAIRGAEFIESTGFTGIPLILTFMVVAGFINLFIGSASAKWAIMAPVFVPMMMHLGYSPELTQAAYRIADSTTNIITPLMPYFAIVIAFAQKYDKKVGIGTLIATMLPYSIAFSIVWVVMLVIWLLLGIDLGPGSPIHYTR
ncbi:aminobenzoyl-glutamate transport protein [Caldalkalibacillus uzonensis]|uniref:Aminobenzoyl-glutamate transport protein n=1 Tax=Caldalkalibacillus uzonensis TaxID=353224 RepID=A0ABU0CXL6_9BACI|nr:AbgT family transporter [Caldalkalibacillus uzonensis]MDQ0340337.1 aminobenzoyl-glutamate transport protein [Caldalkalibacillus uzonensis]